MNDGNELMNKKCMEDAICRLVNVGCNAKGTTNLFRIIRHKKQNHETDRKANRRCI